MRSSVVPGSAQPFNFKEAFHLTEAEVDPDEDIPDLPVLNNNPVCLNPLQALEVSDHFPVEVDLKPSHRYIFRHEL